MKVLSFRQPWAELILLGRKSIDIRKLNSHYRGDFLVHASKHIDRRAMRHFGFDDLPVGAIVGKSSLTSVVRYFSHAEFVADRARHLVEWGEWGAFGYVLGNPVRVEPIPFIGPQWWGSYDGEVKIKYLP